MRGSLPRVHVTRVNLLPFVLPELPYMSRADWYQRPRLQGNIQQNHQNGMWEN